MRSAAVATRGESDTARRGRSDKGDEARKLIGSVGKTDERGDSIRSSVGCSCHAGRCAASWARTAAASPSVINMMASSLFTSFPCKSFRLDAEIQLRGRTPVLQYPSGARTNMLPCFEYRRAKKFSQHQIIRTVGCRQCQIAAVFSSKPVV